MKRYILIGTKIDANKIDSIECIGIYPTHAEANHKMQELFDLLIKEDEEIGYICSHDDTEASSFFIEYDTETVQWNIIEYATF